MCKRLVLALVVAAAGCRGGCGGPGAGEGGAKAGARLLSAPEPDDAGPVVAGGTLRVHVEVEPPTLNPLVEHDAWTVWICVGPLYESLLRQDPRSGDMAPLLAASVEAEGDRRLRFTLRPDVRWHDGRPLVPADVVETFRRLLEPGAAPDLRADLGALETVEAAGPDQVVFVFSDAAPLSLQAIAHVPILPAHRFTSGDLRPQAASRTPVGTGPFRFVEWRPGERIVLERNPDYFGTPAHLARIELRIVPDREAALELFRRGELDLLWQVSPAAVDRALVDRRMGGARIVPVWLARYLFVVWNERRPALADRRVRQALTMLVDRTRYIKVVHHGRARPVTGPYLPGSPSLDAAVPPWPFDPPRARALLDSAGIVDHDGDGVREALGAPFHVAFLLSPPGSPTLEPLVTMMQEDFRRSGVVLDIVPIDWPGFLERLRAHGFDAAALMWNDIKPLQDNLPLFHSSQAAGGQNYGAFANASADRLLEDLRRTPPGPARFDLEHQLHRLIDDEQPYTFIASPEVDSLVAARLHGYRPDESGPGFARLWVSP